MSAYTVDRLLSSLAELGKGIASLSADELQSDPTVLAEIRHTLLQLARYAESLEGTTDPLQRLHDAIAFAVELCPEKTDSLVETWGSAIISWAAADDPELAIETTVRLGLCKSENAELLRQAFRAGRAIGPKFAEEMASISARERS